LEKFNFLIGTYIGTIKAMFSPRLWIPYLLFALVSLLLLLLFANPFLPGVGQFFAWLAQSIAGTPAVTHYPDLYVFLPRTYGWVIVVVSVFLEAVLIGAGFLMFSGYYQRERIGFGKAFRQAKEKYIQVTAVWLFYTVVFLAMLMVLPKLFDSLIGGSPRRMMAFNVALRLAGSAVLAVFMYVIPYVLLTGERFSAAIGKSVKTFFKNIVSSYMLAVIPYLIVLPFTVALFDPFMLVRKFSPEIVLYLIIGETIANMLASFVFVSSVLRFHWEYAE
jgi:hypothetical protein